MTEPADHEHSDLREFLVLIRRHALLIAFMTIATAAATFLVTLRQPEQYTAGATLLYTPSAANAGADPTRAIDTIVRIGGSNVVLAPVAKHFRLSVPQLKQDVTIAGDLNADTFTVAATLGSASEAATLANSVATALIDYRANGQKDLLRSQISFLEQQLRTFAGKTDPSAVATATGLRTELAGAQAQLAVYGPELSVLTPATIPTSASSPHPRRDAAIGLFVGLVLGIMLSALRDRLDRRIRGVDEVEAIYRAPMLGMVPFTKRRVARAELLADFSGAGPLADAYRTIRTNLSLFQLNNSDKSVVVVTSAVAAESKSAVAANLAHVLSVTGKQVLAVSADLRNPTLHEYFGVGTPDGAGQSIPILQRVDARIAASRAGFTPHRLPAGLVQVLAGEVTLNDAVCIIPLTTRERASGGSLALLANSSTFFDPAALFSSGQMQQFLQLAKQKYDVVVIDTPPLLVSADAALLAQGADVVVMVARLKHLTRNQARRAIRVMAATHIAPTGIIVTGDVDEPGYGYGYRYGFDQQDAEASPDTDDDRPARNRA